MQKGALQLLGASVWVAVVASQDAPLRLSPSEARTHVRQLATVCGRVVATGCERSTGRALLHLDRVGRSNGFQVALGSEERPDHSFEIADRYFHRDVCATGTIEKMGNQFAITVADPVQLRIEREPSPTPAIFGAGAILACASGLKPPEQLHYPPPSYPARARQAGKTGTVVMQVLVLTDGMVGDVRVVEPPSGLAEFDEEAVKTVKGWRFKPGLFEGRAVSVVVQIDLSFSLR